jgi:eukaryotic-like serine/threonine-protein kinase
LKDDVYVLREGNGFRLPTEAEFEYACRAGTTTRFYWGDDPTAADEYAWTNRIAVVRSHPVAQKKPNAFGLFDMVGNVWDMCQDVYEARTYQASAAHDPTGPTARTKDSRFAIRGGSWLVGPMYCRSACRHETTLHFRFTANGFRVVRQIDSPADNQ